MAISIASRQRSIARLEARILRLRAHMAKLMDRTTDANNPKLMAPMMRVLDQVGGLQDLIAGYQQEIDVLTKTAGDAQLQAQASRVVRKLNLATRRYNSLHRRASHSAGHGHGSPGAAAALHARMAAEQTKIHAAQKELAAILPVGGHDPLPPPPPPADPQPAPADPVGLYIINRDPRGLENDARFQELFDAFSCKVPHGSPATPDALTPNFSIFREFRTADIVMPDGASVEFWGFTGQGEAGQYPSKIIRIPQGRIFHGTMQPRKGTHTIHWHGIEPTSMNDGVGKLSFEVSSQYTYQWRAAEPGFYFYHCHHNTPLHFEIGMVGAMMVDAPPPAGDPLEAGFLPTVTTEPAGYPTGGPGYTLRVGTGVTNPNGDEVERYDVEAIWFVDDVDPRWHVMSHDEGLGCPFGDDAGLNRFDPAYFLISGVPQGTAGFTQTVQVRAGQKLLIRLVCGCYSLQTNIFRPATGADAGLTAPTAGMDGTIISMDARTLGHGPFVQYANEVPLAAGQEFELTAARRFEILFEPGDEHVGDHVYKAEFFKFIAEEGTRGIKHVGALGIDHASALIRVLPRL